MTTSLVFRLSQLLIIIPCALREWINMFTDIGQYERVTKLSLKLMSFPTQENASTLFNRAFDSVVLAKGIAMLWIIVHLVIGTIISVGIIVLLINLKASSSQYNQKKLTCFVGLALGIFSYVFLVGFFAMDYFLSWMQNINFNSDITGYSLPLIGALLYLTVKDPS